MARVFEKSTGKEFPCDRDMITDLVNTGRFTKKKPQDIPTLETEKQAETVTEQVKVTSNRARGRSASVKK